MTPAETHVGAFATKTTGSGMYQAPREIKLQKNLVLTFLPVGAKTDYKVVIVHIRKDNIFPGKQSNW